VGRQHRGTASPIDQFHPQRNRYVNFIRSIKANLVGGRVRNQSGLYTACINFVFHDPANIVSGKGHGGRLVRSAQLKFADDLLIDGRPKHLSKSSSEIPLLATIFPQSDLSYLEDLVN
jgi:hypothetical protein